MNMWNKSHQFQEPSPLVFRVRQTSHRKDVGCRLSRCDSHRPLLLTHGLSSAAGHGWRIISPLSALSHFLWVFVDGTQINSIWFFPLSAVSPFLPFYFPLVLICIFTDFQNNRHLLTTTGIMFWVCHHTFRMSVCAVFKKTVCGFMSLVFSGGIESPPLNQYLYYLWVRWGLSAGAESNKEGW